MRTILSLLLLCSTIEAAGTTLTNGTWQMVQTDGVPEGLIGWEKLVYSPAFHRAVMMSYFHDLSTEPNSGVVAYDFAANRWDLLDVLSSDHSENGPESGHQAGMFVWDSNRNVYVTYCCASNTRQPETVYHTWWLDPFGLTGRDKFSSPKPGYLAMEMAGGFDPTADRFILHGQAGGDNGTWSYNPSTNAWTKLTPTEVVAGGGSFPTTFDDLGMSSMTYGNGKLYLFGGRYGYPGSYFNDLYTFNVGTNTWTKLNPTPDPVNGLPSARQKAGWAYDSTNNVFLLFGGHNDSGLDIPPSPLSDTWIYNPTTNTWTKLSPAASPTMSTGAFERMTYDSDHNAFVLVVRGDGGYTGGVGQLYPMQTWFFRYSGTGQDVGFSPTTPTPTAGSINRSTTGWAKTPMLVSSGSSLYAGWVETGSMWETTDAQLSHPYVSQFSSGSWSSLGSWNSLDSEFSGHLESYDPSIVISSGSPWISYHHYNDTSGQTWAIAAKRWTGSAWTGGHIGIVNAGGGSGTALQTRSQLVDIAGTPYIAFMEVDKGYFPSKTFVYVKAWNGSSWVSKGGALNVSSGNTVAGSMGMGSDGTNPIVAWTEYTSTDANNVTQTNPQLYVSKWNGSSWTQLGTSLNVNSSTSGWSFDPSVAYFNSQPYVAWTERTQTGQNQLYVKTWNGSSWSLVGSGSLNRNASTGWSFAPKLVADSSLGFVYLAWVEQADLGQMSKAYVSKWNGSSWTALGSSLNADATNGSAQRVAIAVYSSQPVVAWGEVKLGSTRQIYSKQWTGSAWAAVGTTSGGDPNWNTTVSIPESTLSSKPSLGQQISDPTFNNLITRVSDATTLGTDHPVPIYARLNAWNSNQTKILLAGNYVVDASTYVLLRQLPAYSDPRWSPVDPDVVYFTDGNAFKKISVSTGTETTLHTFTEYVRFSQGEQQEELSQNGRYTMLIGFPSPSTAVGGEIFVYDITNDVKHTTMPYLQGNCGTAGAAWVAPSPSGAYAIVDWPGNTASRFCGVEAYDLNMNYIGKVGLGFAHGDLVMDSNGVEWWIDSKAALSIGITGPRLVKNRIPSGYDDYVAGDTSGNVSMLFADWFIGGHISCKSSSWCAISNYDTTSEELGDTWLPYEQEIHKLYLDSTEAVPHVDRLAHHRSNVPYVDASCPSLASYWAQPHATMSRDGTKILFGSTWGQTCTAESYLLNIGVASSAPAPPPVVTGKATIRGKVRVQ